MIPPTTGSLIDEIVRQGARRMLATAIESEINSYIFGLSAEIDEGWRRLCSKVATV